MTLEQILSPAVMDWIQENDNLPKEQVIQEFDKWLVENEESINESVKNNIDEINECIKRGCEKSQILLESASDDDDDFLKDISFDDGDEVADDDDDDKPISGKSESDEVNTGDVLSKIEGITGKVILTSNIWEGDKSKSNNINDVINAVYDSLERRNISHKKNTALWSKFNVSKVKSMAALFAFTDLREADLSSWDTSKVRNMEGMFYKSSFDNDSISGWDVGNCINFKRMFTYSKFKQSISSWSPGFVLKPEYDSDGKIIRGKKIKVQVDLPLIGANADEEDAMLSAYWDSVLDSLPIDENKENKSNKPMKYILDYKTFINEGFGEYVKKGISKIKSFFKNIAIKIDKLVAMFDKNGKIIEASSPYTALNYISNGEVNGVTAFTSVKNEFLNGNVQSIASIVESPEYYGIIDEDSIEYRNYETMVSMINEHYAKYGEKLNEDRVGFKSESGGLTGVTDITTSRLKDLIDTAIRTTPGELAKLDFDDEEVPQSGSIIIFGSPGVGKTTIPKSIIKEWNKNNESNKKAIMVVECGDLTIDGFSLPIPTKKTLGEFLSEHPEVKRRASEAGYLKDDAEYMDNTIDVSTEALKTWLPAYKKGATEEETNLRNDICNGYIMTKMGKNGRIEQTETTEGGIILFDEFFRANEQIFKILMQIVLNRTFNNGEYILGNKWAIICCSNRPNDDKQVQNSIKTSPGATLGTRFGGGIYNFIPDFDEWKKWAIKHGHFDAVTLKFIMEEKDPNNGEYLNWHNIEKEGASKNKLGYATPRTWSMLMNELYIIMKVKNYSSIDEIPQYIIREKAEGLLGMEMADKYIKYLNIHKKNQISYDAILNNSKYMIPKDVESTCGAVIRELYNHICTTFDNENLPKDDQMVNMFNFIKNNYNPNGDVDGGPKDNYIRPLYATLFYKFGFFENKDGFLKLFPKFVTAVMKMYGIKSGNELVKFINEAPTL